jgi:hypothetical protein
MAKEDAQYLRSLSEKGAIIQKQVEITALY